MVQFEAFLVESGRTTQESTESCTKLAGECVCTQQELPGCLELDEVKFFFSFPFKSGNSPACTEIAQTQ